MEQNKKCVICYENILEKKKLFKICSCTDSLCCEECYELLNDKKLIKCPVCKKKLKYFINKHFFSNLYIYLNVNKLLFFNIFINLIVVNLIIYYKYYNNTDYPLIKHKDEFELNSYILLKDYIYYSKYLVFHKKLYFLAINVFNLVLYPISYFIVNICILNTRIQILPYLTKHNKIQLYVNIGIQTISCFVILVGNHYLIYLEIYLIIISLFYSLITITFLYSFLLIMIFENFKFIKDTYMTFEYKIKINNIEEYTEPLLEDNYITVTVI